MASLSSTHTDSVTSTASFVTEVLATVGRMEKEDLNDKLGKLSKRIEEVKVDVYNSLQQVYSNFYPSLDTAHDLTERVKVMTDDMQAVSNRIEQEIRGKLNRSTTEFQDLSCQLEESTCMLAVLEKLVKIHDEMQSISEAMSSCDYIRAAHSIVTIENLLQERIDNCEEEVQILMVLRDTQCMWKGKLILDIQKCWNTNVKWDLRSQQEEASGKEARGVSIASTPDVKETLANCAQAMHDVGALDGQLKLFSSHLLQYLLKPVVAKRARVELMVKGNPAKVDVLPRKKHAKPDSLQETLEKINSILDFLNKYLLDCKVEMRSGNGAEAVKTVTLMEKVGALISEECCDLILKDLLTPSIPSTSKELETYHHIIAVTEKFQKNLVATKFIQAENTMLLDYVNNVNVLFANKKCQEILQKALELMTSDLHNTVKVTAENPHGDLPSVDVGHQESKSKMAKNPKSSVSSNLTTFKLPTCLISIPVQSLITLVYTTLVEATTDCTQECAVQLFYSVRNIFELFCSVVPNYHKEALASLPQLSALHHNNCMFIGHHLLTMGHQFHSQLPAPLCTGAATFVDQVNKIRHLGTECFLQQMTAQKQQLIKTLRGAQGFQNISEDSNYLEAERSVKQCLHQLQHLSNIWKNVLPHSIYNKSIGTLVNSLIVEVLSSITQLEDISSDDAMLLHSLLIILEEKVPGYLEPNETSEDVTIADITQHVSKWIKFKELLWLLNAELQNIGDRWADGKGPLAAEFKASEVKQLLRALFQNTDRRSAILAKIR